MTTDSAGACSETTPIQVPFMADVRNAAGGGGWFSSLRNTIEVSLGRLSKHRRHNYLDSYLCGPSSRASTFKAASTPDCHMLITPYEYKYRPHTDAQGGPGANKGTGLVLHHLQVGPGCANTLAEQACRPAGWSRTLGSGMAIASCSSRDWPGCCYGSSGRADVQRTWRRQRVQTL